MSAERRPREQAVYGVNAALAVAAHRPESILRVFHTEARRQEVGPLLKATAARRKPYREVDDEELSRIARTQHHEGVAVVTTPLPLLSVEALVEGLPSEAVIMALDGVDNPHNLGAILRSAAWFGASGLIFCGGDRPLRALPGAAMRVAQGGAEVVPCASTSDLPAALDALRGEGVRIFGADARSASSVPGTPLPRPLCLVMGSEGDGLTSAVKRRCDQMIAIPGAGQIESLNVAVAAGILLSAALAPAPAKRAPAKARPSRSPQPPKKSPQPPKKSPQPSKKSPQPPKRSRPKKG